MLLAVCKWWFCEYDFGFCMIVWFGFGFGYVRLLVVACAGFACLPVALGLVRIVPCGVDCVRFRALGCLWFLWLFGVILVVVFCCLC